MGNLGAEKAKNQGLGWQQGCGGGALAKAPEEKWGKMGKNGGKMGENGEEMGGKGTGCTTQVSLFSPFFPHFSPFPPHFPPFFPIFPHFPPFFLAMGTLWVRLWVQYPPPEPGTSEPCDSHCDTVRSFPQATNTLTQARNGNTSDALSEMTHD